MVLRIGLVFLLPKELHPNSTFPFHPMALQFGLCPHPSPSLMDPSCAPVMCAATSARTRSPPSSKSQRQDQAAKLSIGPHRSSGLDLLVVDLLNKSPLGRCGENKSWEWF